MKTFLLSLVLLLALAGCQDNPQEANNTNSNLQSTVGGGQENVNDTISQKDIVKIASQNPDFSTLVAAVKSAGLVTTLSNAGPFTVFAPNNAAFEKLPEGTVESLLEEDKKNQLADILQYHVYIGVLQPEMLTDGRVLGMVNGQNATIHLKDGKPTINEANIIATVPASNGIIHVIDNVIMPPAK